MKFHIGNIPSKTKCAVLNLMIFVGFAVSIVMFNGCSNDAPPDKSEAKSVSESDTKKQDSIADPVQAAVDPIDRAGEVQLQFQEIMLAYWHYAYENEALNPYSNVAEHYHPSGRLHLSWRVHLLPYLGESALYQQFKLDEPWDSVNNKRLLAKMPDVFRAPDDPMDSTTTRIRGVESILETSESRPRTMLPITPGGMPIKFQDVTDSLRDTVLFVEVAPEKATPWTKPDGLPLHTDNPAKAFGKIKPDGIMAAFADGSVKMIQPDTKPTVWSHVLDFADGEDLPNDFLVPVNSAECVTRNKFPLHLIYQTYFVNGLFVIHPKAIAQSNSAKAMLTQLTKDGVLPPIELYQDLETVIFWLNFEDYGPWDYFLLRFMSPTSRETVLKKFNVNPKELWPHDERTWLIAPREIIENLLISRGDLPSRAGLWFGMDLNQPVSGRFFLYPDSRKSSPIDTIEESFQISNLRQVNLIEVTLDLSGATPFDVKLGMASPLIATQLKEQIQQRLQRKILLDAAPKLKAMINQMQQDLTITLAAHPKDPSKIKRFVHLRLEHSTQFADIYSKIFWDPIKSAIAAHTKARLEKKQKNKLKQLGLAFHNYYATFGHFPPSSDSLVNGKPMLSWRVHLLRYLDQDELYDQFQMFEPWDSPHNIKLLEQMPEIYRTEGVTKPGWTSIMTFSGKGTPFVEGAGPLFRDITDGTSETILCVQAGPDKAVPWTKPIDLPFDPADPVKALGQLPEKMFIACMMDGSVRWIHENTSGNEIRKMINPNDRQNSILSKIDPDTMVWKTPTEWALLASLNLNEGFNRDLALDKLAPALAENGEVDQALEVAHEIEIINLKLSTLGNIAESLARSGDFAQAFSVARSIKSANKVLGTVNKVAASEVRPLCKIASAQLKMGNRERALSTIKQASNLIQKIEEIDSFQQMEELNNHISLTTVLVEAGKKQEALKLLKESVKAIQDMDYFADQPNQLSALAPIMAKAGDKAGALDLINQISKLMIGASDSSKVPVLTNVALTYFELGDKERASLILKATLEYVQKIYLIKIRQIYMSMISQVLIKTDDLKQIGQIALKIENPDCKVFMLCRTASALIAKGDKEQALELLSQALKATKKNEKTLVLVSISSAFSEAGETEQSLAILQRAIKIAQDQTDLRECVIGLATQPITGIPQEYPSTPPVLRMKKNFTAKEKQLANEILEAIQEK